MNENHCPTCGACKTCGAKQQPTNPWWFVPYQPWWGVVPPQRPDWTIDWTVTAGAAPIPDTHVGGTGTIPNLHQRYGGGS